MSTNAESSLRRWQVQVFATSYLAYAFVYLCRKNWSVAMLYLPEALGYDKARLQWLTTLYNGCYMGGQFACGALSDRFGSRIVVGAGLLLSAGVSVCMGLSEGLTTFVILMALNGIFQATGWSGNVKNMTAWFPREVRGTVMGFWGTCFVVGGFCATIIATWFAGADLFGWGWRGVFFGPAIILAAFGVLYLIFARNKPGDVGLPGLHEVEVPHADASLAVVQEDDETPAWKLILRSKTFWVAAAGYFVCKMSRYVFVQWLPTYMHTELGYSKEQSGYASACYELGFFGVIFAGLMSTYVFSSRRFPVSCLMFLGMAGACMLYPTLSHMGLQWNVVGMILIGFMSFGPDAVLSGPAAMDIGSERAAAKAAGWINGVGSVGQLMSAGVAVQISDRFGWNSVFYLFAGMALLGAALTATQWNFGGAKKSA